MRDKNIGEVKLTDYFTDDREDISVSDVLYAFDLVTDLDLRNRLIVRLGLERHVLQLAVTSMKTFNRDLEKLKSEIKFRRLNIKKLSNLSDLHANTIYNFLNGRTDISLRNYKKLVKHLGFELVLKIPNFPAYYSKKKIAEGSLLSTQMVYKGLSNDAGMGIKKYYRLCDYGCFGGEIGLRSIE